MVLEVCHPSSWEMDVQGHRQLHGGIKGQPGIREALSILKQKGKTVECESSCGRLGPDLCGFVRRAHGDCSETLENKMVPVTLK